MDVAASEFFLEKEKKYDLNFKEEVSCIIKINVLLEIECREMLMIIYHAVELIVV